MTRYLIFIFTSIILVTCNNAPADDRISDGEMDDIEKHFYLSDATELKGAKATIIAMADIYDDENEHFTGKAYFTEREDTLTFTLILNNANPITHTVFLGKGKSCEITNISEGKNEFTPPIKNIGAINVENEGITRVERIIQVSDNPKTDITDFMIYLATDNQVIACGEIKNYIEENK